MRLINFCNRAIEYSFYALLFLVPLAFASNTSELFEFNKMWLTFVITIIIGVSWIAKMILQRRILLCRTPLDIPIFLFLASQIISTLFSWDMHVSIWGYYSRFNGGLFSILSYVFLYYAFLSNFVNQRGVTLQEGVPTPLRQGFAGQAGPNAITMAKRLIFISLFSGLIVALWGLPSHFGYDPTCLLIRGSLDITCWTADFQPKVRIFSTLGQPAWLAAYLAILIPIAIAYAIKQTRTKGQEARNYLLPVACYLLLVTLFYIDLLYTRARSGILAVFAFFFILFVFFIFRLWKTKSRLNMQNKALLIIIVIFPIVTFFIGQPFSQLDKFTFEGVKKTLFKQDVAKDQKAATPKEPVAHLGELGGTDSGTIRLYVWRGALEAWRNYPIFGTGPETFAFAYYKFKPQGHNLTSEYNFIYNKAHNEYLNYLATTGAFGLGTYLLMIGSFLFLSFKKLKAQMSKVKTEIQNSKLQKEKLSVFSFSFELCVLSFALLAGYVSILITNFFGFSVVITNLYLFLIPAFIFSLNGSLEPRKNFAFPQKALKLDKLSKITASQTTAITGVVIIGLYMIYVLFSFWRADVSYATGYNLDRTGSYQEAYPNLYKAISQRGSEPVFKDEWSFNNAILAASLLRQQESKLSSEGAKIVSDLVQEAIKTSNGITSDHAKNVIFWKTRVRVFYTLTQVNPSYFDSALDAIKKAKELAPTDAVISYNLGVLYGQKGEIGNAIGVLLETVRLKPDYRDAHYALGLMYNQASLDEKGKVVNQKFLEKAIGEMKYILSHISPNDQGAKEALKSWEILL